jgi:hypothetical protein
MSRQQYLLHIAGFASRMSRLKPICNIFPLNCGYRSIPMTSSFSAVCTGIALRVLKPLLWRFAKRLRQVPECPSISNVTRNILSALTYFAGVPRHLDK